MFHYYSNTVVRLSNIVVRLKAERRTLQRSYNSRVRYKQGKVEDESALNVHELTHRKQQLEVSMIEYSVLMASYQPFFLK